MAASKDVFINSEHQTLLRALKSTVEGLLATRTSNVFSTYGGLPRMYRAVEDILRNGLKERPGLFGNVTDYWGFIKGLRWLHPTLAPALQRASRFSEPMEPEEGDPGRAWLRKSLENHNLATQLKVLTDNKHHLKKCYEDSSFLCNNRCVCAMLLCLQAVEQNNPAILAQIDPTLLTRADTKISHVRSASLPTVFGHESVDHNVNLPLFSPPREKEFVHVTTTAEHATPISSNIGLSPDGKSAARNVLMSILEGRSTGRADDINSNKFSPNSSSNQLGIAYNRNDDISTDLAFSPVMDSPLSLRKVSSDTSLLLGRAVCRCNTEIRRDDVLNANVNTLGDNTYMYHVCQRCGLVKKTSELEQQGQRNILVVDNKVSRVEKNGNNDDDFVRKSQHTEPMDISPSSIHPSPSTQKKTHVRSKSDATIQAMKKMPKQRMEDAVEEETASLLSTSLPARVAEMEKAMEKEKHEDDKDETDSGVAGVTDSTYISRPMEGEFLMTYLSSQDFRTCPDLDKENAHFSISEALIAAIEQIRCTQVVRRLSEDEEEDASDEEIQKLKHQIRVRRRERLHKRAQFPAFNSDGTSVTTSGDTEPFSSPPGSTLPSDSCPSSEDDDSHRQASIADSSISQSQYSSFSESESRRTSLNPNGDRSSSMTDSSFYSATNDSTSAEAVAISLMKKFSHTQLPKASDLEWLVSEQDVPQALLPMPTSLPVSPDEGENSDLVSTLTKRTRLRGNLQWAPPRAQVIFNIHPPPKRKIILAKQSYMCAGCGTKVEPGFMKRFRYCEYLGKYFCQCCHTNASSIIPGKIIHKWDFRKYNVSNFSLDLLNKMHTEPLFNIADINPALYRKVRSLEAVRETRQQLYHLRNFLRTCRLGQNLYVEFEKLPHHLTHDPNIFSISDLLHVKNGEMIAPLKEFVEDAVTHVKQCELCQAKGFYCEVCGNDKDIIFPFEVQKCVQCALCGSCFHRGCFHSGNCPKCARIKARREQLAQAKPSVSDSSDEEQE